MINLIYDRTSTDVARIEVLRKKVKNNTATATELSEWLTSLKGAYNYTDLNRVGEAIKTLATLLNGYGYINSIEPKTDWEVGDKPNQEQMEKYLSDLQKLKDTYYVYPTTPQVPDDMVSLNYEEANEIEKILYDIDFLLNNMPKVFIHSGVAKCGQNRIYQHRFRRTQIWSVLESFSQFADTDIVNDIASQEEGKILEGTEKLNLVQIEKTQRVVDFITSFNNNMNELDRLIGEEVE